VLSEDELRRALRRVPLIGADGPFHRFVDLWFVHQNLAGGKKTEVLAGLGAKMLGGRFTPRGTFETLYIATTAEGLLGASTTPEAVIRDSASIRAVVTFTSWSEAVFRRFWIWAMETKRLITRCPILHLCKA
jgi:hypothetical protein